MTGVIRLDAIPIMGLPQIVKSDPVEPASTKVNCVLHCEAFPTTQHLEVRVNGALQQQVEEGHQLVFCWQLATATDEVRIKLFKRGVLEQHWQGCWNERDALLSLGTLPVQVFFDGRLQPPVAAIGGSTSAATLKALQPGPEEGSSRESGAVLSTSSNGTHEPGKPESELRATNGVVVVQDLIVVAEPKSVEEVPLLDDRGSEEVQVQEREERQDDGEEREAGAAEEQKQQEGREEDNDKQSPNGDAFDEWDDEEYPELEEEYEEGTFGVHEENGSATGHEDEPEAVRKNEPGTAGQGEMEEQEAADLSEQEGRGLLEQEQAVVHADLHTVDGITVMRPRLAAFHASSVTPQKTLEALKALVATMANKTVIVDLRRHSRTGKKKYQAPGVLSKDGLRATFGGSYWDRGSAIQTTYQRLASSSGWRQILVNPDLVPDGIPSLVQHLQGGGSLIVMDQAAYTQSPRRAVVEELQRRVSDLVVGQLG